MHPEECVFSVTGTMDNDNETVSYCTIITTMTIHCVLTLWNADI